MYAAALVLAVAGAAATTCAAAAAAATAQLSPHWSVLAPFASGKTELDAEPIPFSDAVRAAAKRRVPSELVRDGVAWARVDADPHTGAVRVEPHGVDWNALVGALNRMEVLEFTGWAHATLTVTGGALVRVRLACAGATHFYVQRGTNASAPLEHHAGDVYHSGRVAAIVGLPPGAHRLVLRLRAKVRTEFACSARALVDAAGRGHQPLQLHAPTHVPDVVDGVPAGALLAVPATNTGAEWLARVACVATIAGGDGADGGAPLDGDATPPLAMPPGALLMLPCRLRAPRHTVLAAQCAAARSRSGDGDAVVPVTVHVTGLTCDAGTRCTRLAAPPAVLQHTLRCRHLHQSIVLTLRDHDGSVQSAAAVAPLPVGGEGEAGAGAGAESADEGPPLPVLLTLHGTGVTASRQADAYKVKAAGAREYTFGVAGYWLLAPARHGAHNHAGTGQWHALTAVRALAQLVDAWRQAATHGGGGGGGAARCEDWRSAPHCVPRVDSDRVLFSGHSMGGAGAWHAATAAADVAIAAAPLAGWLVKESYGDANSFAALDASEPQVQPRLKGVLLASVQDQRPDAHAANLVGVPVHVRVGARDATTPPYLSRRMVRILTEAGAGGPPPHSHRHQQSDGGGALGRSRGGGKWPRYEEVDGVGDVGTHWWWSTAADDDGGVVNDATLRAFYEAQRHRHSTASAARCARLPPGVAACADARHHSTLAGEFAVLSTNAHVYSRGRAGVRILQLDSPGARASVHVRRFATGAPPRVGGGGGGVWALATINVRRLRVPVARATLAPPGACVEALEVATNTSEPLPAVVCVDGVGFVAAAEAAAATATSSDVCRTAADDGDGSTAGSADSEWAPCAAPPGSSSDGGGRGDGRVSIAPSGGTFAADKDNDGDPDAYERLERGPATAGPMRAVTASPFYIVIGTSGPGDATAAYAAAALFLAQLHAAASEALAPIVNDTQLLLRLACTPEGGEEDGAESALCLPPGSNLVLLGSSAHNVVTRALACAVPLADGGASCPRRSPTFPVVFEAAPTAAAWGSFSVPLPPAQPGRKAPRRAFSGGGLSVVSTAGWWDARAPPGSRARLALVLAATDADGVWGLLRLAEPTVPPMTRAPFSNLFPDVVVASAERLRRRGMDGLLVAGFYDADWRLAPEATYHAGRF